MYTCTNIYIYAYNVHREQIKVKLQLFLARITSQQTIFTVDAQLQYAPQFYVTSLISRHERDFICHKTRPFSSNRRVSGE